MLFTAKERILLLYMLPPQDKRDHFYVVKILEDLRMALSLNEDEAEKVKVEKGRIEDLDKVAPKEIEIGKTANKIIKDILFTVDENKNVNAENLVLFEKFGMENEIMEKIERESEELKEQEKTETNKE